MGDRNRPGLSCMCAFVVCAGGGMSDFRRHAVIPQLTYNKQCSRDKCPCGGLFRVFSSFCTL